MHFFSVDSLLDTLQESFLSTNCEKHLPTFITVQGEFLNKMRGAIFDHIMHVHVIHQRKNLIHSWSQGLIPGPISSYAVPCVREGYPVRSTFCYFWWDGWSWLWGEGEYGSFTSCCKRQKTKSQSTADWDLTTSYCSDQWLFDSFHEESAIWA